MRVLVLAAVAPALACGRIAFDPVGGSGDPDAQSCTPQTPPPATRVVNAGDDFFTIVQTLGPGEVVEVHAGTYQSPGFYSPTWSGTQAQPIIVRSAPGEHVVLQGVSTQNVFDLFGQWFTFTGFEITTGDIGIRLHGTTHATLEDLQLHAIVREGLTCNQQSMPCSFLTLRRLEISGIQMDIGTGMGLGCTDGSCPLTDSVVEGCYLHDLSGTTGAGIDFRGGASGTRVRDNVIVRVSGPGIIAGGTQGTLNIIERNLVWNVGTKPDNGIQIEGQVVVRNNIVIDAGDWGIDSFEATTPPSGAVVVHNTVVNPGGMGCFAAGNWDMMTSGQIVANNAFYCEAGSAVDVGLGAPAAVFANNVIRGSSNMFTGITSGISVAADLGDPSTAAVYPPAGSALIDTGDPAHAATDDFNGNPRDATPDVGAYERSTATNPGWPVIDGMKPLPPPPGCP